MNPIKTEEAIRALELMVGPQCGRVPSDNIVTTSNVGTNPNDGGEIFVIDANGKMRVEWPRTSPPLPT